VPSVLAADFGRLADEIADVEAAGVKMVQFDIMDGRSCRTSASGLRL
jgi:ribulose-phosphate 3-epimerase